ncbi:MAG: Lon protease [Spirochaetes bacterium ADurb.Bin269]|nr:MAG: Lon protease [Spirochaetes bacterium ADurb.Bin269]
MSDSSLDDKLLALFPGKVVRKDLTQSIKQGANVPIFVLEYLLGMYCSTNDEATIKEGIDNVKKILSENYVRPDEKEKVKMQIRENGSYKIIDRLTASLNDKKDTYEVNFSNLGITKVPIADMWVKQYEKLLSGGIWCIITVGYSFEEGSGTSPWTIDYIKPIQLPSMDLQEFLAARKSFTESEWIDVLLRSIGMEPLQFNERVKWHLLSRLIPFVENNVNMCELGPRGTGKSHVYKEISPASILISGGQTTVANLFYNLGTKSMGLVGLWDVVAFDEVAGINFKDKDGIQIMKDFMASGSFARGKEMLPAFASLVFVGNINQPVETLIKTSHLLTPFPSAMIDSAFFDRFHAYIPGWEIPKYKPEFFTRQFGLIVDYLSSFFIEIRKQTFSNAIDSYFKLGNNLNQRDVIAVRKISAGFLKLLYPAGDYDKEAVRRCLEYALETRRRIKEQLKKIGGMEFFDVHFSYIDIETLEERFIAVPEQGGGKLIPETPMASGTQYVIAEGSSNHPGVYRFETQIIPGHGAFTVSGLGSNAQAKEPFKIAYEYFKANLNRITSADKFSEHDFQIHVVDMQNAGSPKGTTLQCLVSLCSALMKKPVQQQMVILGDISLGGSIIPVSNLADILQVAFDSGAKRILLPMSSVTAIPTVPGELFAKFQTGFYADAIDAVIKAMGLE